jgi:hypothetical protein
MPTLANIIVNPKATIIDDRIRPDGLRETIVKVTGLLCFL